MFFWDRHICNAIVEIPVLIDFFNIFYWQLMDRVVNDFAVMCAMHHFQQSFPKNDTLEHATKSRPTSPATFVKNSLAGRIH